MRIKELFKKCRDANRKAFVAYIAAGDPDYNTSLDIVDTLIDAGIDILELGVPFSDPLADGEANQLAAARALENGMTPLKVLDMACEIRRKHPEIPLVLFTYINPVAYSSETTFAAYCSKAVESGIDAVLPLDLPPEELNEECREGLSYTETIKNAGLPVITLVAPTTPEERLPLLLSEADAFIYYVSKEGVTGECDSFSAGFADRISQIRNHSDLPVVVGFGISTPEHVKAAVSTGVDGVVVGSAIVRQIEALSHGSASLETLGAFVKSMSDAVR